MTLQLFHLKFKKDITDFKDLCYYCRNENNFESGTVLDGSPRSGTILG